MLDNYLPAVPALIALSAIVGALVWSAVLVRRMNRKPKPVFHAKRLGYHMACAMPPRRLR